MDKDNYTRELLLQNTDFCLISYACQLGRVKGVILELEEKNHHPVKAMPEKLELKEKGHYIAKVMPKKPKTSKRGHHSVKAIPKRLRNNEKGHQA